MFEESLLLFPGWTIWLVNGMFISESMMMMLQIWHFGFSHFLLPVDVVVELPQTPEDDLRDARVMRTRYSLLVHVCS